MPRIRTKRVYDAPAKADGFRVLVDRVWPRGMTKEQIAADWWKDVAPSTDLRRWFKHEEPKWAAFKKRYFAELKANTEEVPALLDVARKRTLTLLYSARDTERNQAVALAEYLTGRLKAD